MERPLQLAQPALVRLLKRLHLVLQRVQTRHAPLHQPRHLVRLQVVGDSLVRVG